MFRELFRQKVHPVHEKHFVVAQLNIRIMPIQRGELFEDPLDVALKKAGLGEVSGGGTLQQKSGEIEYCDIEMHTAGESQHIIRTVVETLNRLGAPKGSELRLDTREEPIPFGDSEGLAVYLNGTDLPSHVYQECDVNVVRSEMHRLLEGIGSVVSEWDGPTETAIYAYGASFKEMSEQLAAFLATYPLCERCRVVQIA
jgi:hypothetical protein